MYHIHKDFSTIMSWIPWWSCSSLVFFNSRLLHTELCFASITSTTATTVAVKCYFRCFIKINCHERYIPHTCTISIISNRSGSGRINWMVGWSTMKVTLWELFRLGFAGKVSGAISPWCDMTIRPHLVGDKNLWTQGNRVWDLPIQRQPNAPFMLPYT